VITKFENSLILYTRNCAYRSCCSLSIILHFIKCNALNSLASLYSYEGKVFLFHAFKAYRKITGIIPVIFKLRIRWKWEVIFTTRPPYLREETRYPLSSYLQYCWNYPAMHNVAGTTQLCTLLLELPSYVHCCWDCPVMYIAAGTTQLCTMLLGLPSYALCCLDYTSMYTLAGTIQLRSLSLRLPSYLFTHAGTNQLLHSVDGTIQICTILLGISSYVQCGCDYSPMYTVARTTQLYTLLLGLPKHTRCYWDYIITCNFFDTTKLRKTFGTTEV